MSNVLNITTSDLELAYEGDLNRKPEYYQHKLDEAVRKFNKIAMDRQWDLVSAIAVRDIDGDLVKDLILKAVSRVFRNEEGFLSESENGYAYQRNQSVASGELRFFPSELEEVFPYRPKSIRRAVSHQQNYGSWGMPG